MTVILELLIIVLLIGTGVIFVLKLKEVLMRLFITLQGPFFGATSEERIRDLLKLVDIKPGDKVVDLGSGDGRVLMALAKKFDITAVGYEIDPSYVSLSRKLIAEAGLTNKITIHDQSFWEVDLSDFDHIVIYCVPRFLNKIERKLEQELKQSARVYSIFFRFPAWKPVAQQGDILLYNRSSVL